MQASNHNGMGPVQINKDHIVVSLPKYEYDRLAELGRQNFKDQRSVQGIIKTFAVIRMYSFLSGTKLVPIHSGVFKSCVGSRNYKKYREFLAKSKVIEYMDEVVGQYDLGKTNNTYYKTEKAKQYRTLFASNSIWFDSTPVPVRLELDKDSLEVFRIKYNHIQDCYLNLPDKRDMVLNVSVNDILTTQLVVKLIKDLVGKKVCSPESVRKRIARIADSWCTKRDIADRRSKIKEIVVGVLKVLAIPSKDKVNLNSLIWLVDSKYRVKTQSKINKKLSYYADLRIVVEGLDKCIRMGDLMHLAKLNIVPTFHKDGKLYSHFANLRKPIRTFIRYKNEPLIEISDIRCAHFTMLPVIFGRNSITLPQPELIQYISLTQQGDLYSEIVKGTSYTRNEIKQEMQPFLSIKNEGQFIYGGDDGRRRTVCNFFKTNYPTIYKELLGWHVQFPTTTIKSVANIVESDIMNPICDDILNEGLHPFRIHDAIYLAEKESRQTSIDVKQRVFDAINSHLTI